MHKELIQQKENQKLLQINRLMPFEGVENFRDMGGYLTEDDRRVKFGYLYRSSALYYSTPQDQQLLKDLGIQLVFDYRDQAEALKEPDPIIHNVINERVPANKIEEIGRDDLFSEAYRANLKRDCLIDFYHSLTLNNRSYRRLVEIALDDKITRFVHHCAAGKDRTGIGAAILYLALGVSRETIMADYLLSTDFLPNYIERNLQQVREVYSPEEIACYRDAFIVKQEYLATFFQVVDQEYRGNDLLYLEKEYGLNEFSREKLKKQYLES